jgi:hypothetical protein
VRVPLNSQIFTQPAQSTEPVPQHYSEWRKLAVEVTGYVINVSSMEV